jgi:DNA-directed RNA polymerase omega subunit
VLGGRKMINLSLDEIAGKDKSIFKMAILAGRRAEEISQGAGILVEGVSAEKPTTIAIQEIIENKVEYKEKKKK